MRVSWRIFYDLTLFATSADATQPSRSQNALFFARDAPSTRPEANKMIIRTTSLERNLRRRINDNAILKVMAHVVGWLVGEAK